ncbi:MAG: ribbon-helix-helix domain-containing protein [Thaumarchaeota archaeon]|jgi:metal-responsive CopG/Arc/MetJ family transcriptional regulator|nr:ribbon-helix-helix domain-containing protein [Candidatus Wolframiiraptor allenii]MCL7394513.1 ribbon-helix-helix domain-containing protein [Candidatus Wolframiiraptor allenii]
MSSEKVRISSSLLRSIDAYLLSDLGRSKGFRSRREVIEEAVRRFLESEGFWSNQRFKHINANGNQVLIYDSLLKRVATIYVGYPDRTFCDLCSEPDCIHVVYALSIPKVAKALAKKGFKTPEHLIPAK